MMNNNAKIYLSEQELQLVCNTEWILTKHTITDKVFQLMGGLSEAMKKIIAPEKNWLPEIVTASSAKIYKGENYLQLPYVLLDYPRCFAKENIFAIRTMFWWGNFFSITLQLSGTYKKTFQQNICANPGLLKNGFYICINENQWHHYFEPDNYIAASDNTPEALQEIITEKDFIKITLHYPLQQWNEMHKLLLKGFDDLLQLLKP